MSERYQGLLAELAQRISPEELRLLKLASREDVGGQALETAASDTEPCDWFKHLEEKERLSEDDLSYLEYVFEASRRPDLLTLLDDYRRQGNTASTIPRLPRMPSARKYHDLERQASEDDVIELAAPPKKR
uniref:astrocytic phosphoprotein PEA-15 n=1 Tax=Myxine glutinosa TaxID=7769 RepID=UPI00358EB8F2